MNHRGRWQQLTVPQRRMVAFRGQTVIGLGGGQLCHVRGWLAMQCMESI